MIKQINSIDFIKYDLEKIFINLNLEEIQGLIYQIKEKELSQENIRKEVISKYALTLPQDIILFLNNIQFEYKNLIIENYKKGEHRSLSKFLNVMKHKKNVIYTFSTDLDIIRNINNITNEAFKLKIGDKNIKKIKIRGIKSENQFETELDNFLEKDKYKICLIQFTSQEENYMNFVKFFIDNKEKEEGVQKKIYIFIVHMNRIFKEINEMPNLKKYKEKREFKNLNEDFSFLSGYYQIFIDNLNGDEKINLPKIITSKSEDLLENYLNLEEELKKNVYKTITHMKYNISLSVKELNKDKYIEKMNNFLQNDENRAIRKLINNCIKKELIKNNSIGLFYKHKITNEKEKEENKGKFKLNISKYDIDILGLIKKYLSSIYKSFFNRFFFLSENDNFLSVILSLSINEPNFILYLNNFIEDNNENIEKNENKLIPKSDINIKYNLLSKVIINYFDEFSFERNDLIFIENQQLANNINILLGLNLPGFRKIIEDILLNIRETIVNNYSINEFNNIIFTKENDGIKYKSELERFNNLTKNEIIKHNQISKILKEYKDKKNIIDEFYNLFINDYLVLISFENFGKNVDLDVVNKFFNLNQYIKSNSVENLKCAKVMNYIECYKYQICLLLKTNFHNKNINLITFSLTLNDKFEQRYDSNILLDYITKFVKKVIFAVYSKIKLNLNNKETLITLKEYFEDAYHNFSKVLTSINCANNLEIIYILKFFAETLFEIEKNESYDKYTINKIFNYFQYRFKGTEKNNMYVYYKNNINNFTSLYKYLVEKIGKSKYFKKIISFLAINEFKQSKNDIIQKKCLDIILSDNEIIKQTNFELIFKDLLKNDDISKNFNQFNFENQLFSCLNEVKNNFILEEILINYFENNINSCLDSILNVKENNGINIEDELILPRKPLYQAFSKSIDILTGSDKNKYNKNLKILYSITFIKIYLRKFVNFLNKGFYLGKNIVTHIDILIKEIRNIKYKNIIRVYIYKLFLLFSNDEKNFLKRNKQYYNSFGVTFFDDFELEIPKNRINYYNFVSFSLLKLNYSEVLKLFIEYPEQDYTNKDKQEVFINQIKNLNIEIFINIIINLTYIKIGLNDDYSKDRCSNFFKFLNKVLSSSDIPNKIRERIYKLLTKYLYKVKDNQEKLINKIDNYEDEKEKFLISLYGLRYCVYSLKNENNDFKNFYACLLHKNEKNFPADITQIPGNSDNYDKDEIIEKAWQEKNLKNLNDRHFNIFKNFYSIILDIRILFLKFILASYLFFADCINHMKDKKKELLKGKGNYIEIMKQTFREISSQLKKLSIDSIEIFMNLIFENISRLMISVGTFDNIEEIEKFENNVDKVIEDAIDSYNIKRNEYIMNNFKLLEKKIDNAENNNYLLVKELVPFDKLDNDMKYFMLTNTFEEEKEKDKNYFKNYLIQYGKIFGYEKIQTKYPLLNQILFGDDKVKNLEHLPNINNFSNYLLNKFSHKLSKKDAGEKKVNDNDFKIDKNLLQKFLNSWQNIGIDKLSENSLLINFLIDNKEQSKENSIFKVYEKFIKYQNEFLEPIIKNSQKKDDIHYFYVDNLQKKINIQDSKNNHIDLSKINLDNIIKKYSKRDIFNNSKTFEYDLTLIEKELGDKILPGKCLFEISGIRTIIFWGEGNPQILTMFAKKYPQVEISDKEKDIIINFAKKNYLEGNNSFKDFYESFHILFFYLNEMKNELSAEKDMKSLLELINPDLNISKDFYDFWKNEGKQFKLNKILEIYLFFEHLYFSLYYQKRKDEFAYGKEKINNDDEINNLFDKLEFKNIFVKALRRYITRYLLDKINLDDINEENLVEKLYKSDLWGIYEMNKFEDIKNKLDKIKLDINIKTSFGLYELLGDKDKEEVNNFVDLNKDNNIDNNDDDNDFLWD